MDDKLFKLYNYLLLCKYKSILSIDITNELNDFKKYIKELEINVKDEIFVNFIIQGLIFNDKLKEALYNLLDIYDFNLEPEEENLIIGYIVDSINRIKTKYPILYKARIVIPFDIVTTNKVYIETIICLENTMKNKE